MNDDLGNGRPSRSPWVVFSVKSFKVSFFASAEDSSLLLLLQVKQQFEQRLEKIGRVRNRLLSGSRTRKGKA